MNNLLRTAAVTGVIAALFSLSGCGGDSAAKSAPPAAKAQGLYWGTVGTHGALFAALVTPDDRIYGIYSISVANAVTDVITGTIAESGNSFSGAVWDTYQSGTSGSDSLTGTYTEGSSFSGTLDEQILTRDFTASIPDAARYQYDSPATLSSVADTWTGFLMLESGIATTVVDGSGRLTGTMNFGCTYSGSLRPDGSGKNFFDVTLSLGSTCAQAGATFKGIAIVTNGAQGKGLILIANDSSNTHNALLLGSNAPPSGSPSLRVGASQPTL